MWEELERQESLRVLLTAGLEAIPHSGSASWPLRGRDELQKDDVALFLFRYGDGLQGAIAMFAGLAAANGFAARMKGKTEIIATHIEEQPRPYPHFMYLVKAIETLVHTGHAPYPVERTLLTTGLHDALLTSRFLKHKQLSTPFLAVQYQPVDYPHAPRPEL
jgi:hypothetical protein